MPMDTLKRDEARQAFVEAFQQVLQQQYDNALILPLEAEHPDVTVIAKKLRIDFDINLTALRIALRMVDQHPDLEDGPLPGKP